MTSEVTSNVESSFCHRTKNLEKSPKTNGTTLVTVYSEVTECNENYIAMLLTVDSESTKYDESYICVMRNQKEIQNRHQI